MKRGEVSFRLFRAPGVALACLLSCVIRTGALTWDSDADGSNGATDGTGTWDATAANWYPGGPAPQADVIWSSGAEAVIGSGGTAGTITLGSPITVGNLTFNAVTGSYVIDGANTLTVAGTELTVAGGENATIHAVLAGSTDARKQGTGTLVVTADNSGMRGFRNVDAGILRLEHNSAMGGTAIHSDVGNGATLEVAGGLSGITRKVFLLGSGAGGIGALHSAGGDNVFAGQICIGNNPNATINVDGGGSLTLSQGIATWPDASRGITKIGDGTLVLNGAGSTYASGTTIEAGTVRVGNLTALGAGGVTLNGGALDLNAYNLTLPSLAGIGGMLTDSGAAGATVVTLTQTVDTEFGGSMQNGATRKLDVTLNSPGRLALTGAGTVVNNFNVKGGGVLEIAGAGEATIAATQIGRDSAGTVEIKDTAALTVTGNFFMGNPRYVAGYVNQSGGTVTHNGGVDLFRIGHWPDETSIYSISGGTLTVATSDVRVGWDGKGELHASGGVLNVPSIRVGRGTSSQGSSVFVSGDAVINVGTFTVGDGSGKYGVVSQSNGTVNVATQMRVGHWGSETSTYGLYGGTLSATNVVVYVGWDGNGVFTMTGGVAEVQQLMLGGGDGTRGGLGTLNLTGGRLAIGAGGLTYRAGYDSENMGGGTLAATANWSSGAYMHFTGVNGDLTIDTSTNTLTLTGNNSGAGGFIKTGVGTLVLGGNSSFAGNVVVTQGTLKASSGTCIPNGVGKGNVRVFGTLDLGGQSIGVNGLNGSGLVDNTGGNCTLTVGNGDVDGTFTGQMLDTASQLSLTKTGAGTLTLTAQNKYSGATTVNGGLLSLAAGQIYNDLGWASRTITVSGGGMIEVGGWADGDTKGLGRVSFAAANLQLNGGGIRYVAATTDGNSDRGFTIGAGGATLEAAGTITWSLNQGRSFGITSTAGGTLALAGNGDGTLNLTLGGSGGLVKSGTGIWTLTGTKAYSGTTVINAGELRVNTTHTGGDTYTVAGGTLAGTGTISSHVIVSGGARVSPGAGGAGTLMVSRLTLMNYAGIERDGGDADDLVQVNGDVDLPTYATVTVSGGMPAPAVILRWTGSNSGATSLSHWTVPAGVSAKIVGKEVQLVPGTGTVFTIR